MLTTWRVSVNGDVAAGRGKLTCGTLRGERLREFCDVGPCTQVPRAAAPAHSSGGPGLEQRVTIDGPRQYLKPRYEDGRPPLTHIIEPVM